LLDYYLCAITLPMLERLLLFYYERQEQEKRYRAVVTQASEGIILVDAGSKNFMRLIRLYLICLVFLGKNCSKKLFTTL
jgi:hypothetical protein